MLIYILIFVSILIPFVSSFKRKSLFVSFVILFVLFGLQYKMTRDWNVYIGKWHYANYTNGTIIGARGYESFYLLLLNVCKPFGLFGYLIVCAMFNLSVFYFYVRKYIPDSNYWMYFAILLLQTGFAFFYIDANRQMLSMSIIMLAVYLYYNSSMLCHKSSYIRYCILMLFFLIAINTHTAAIVSFLLVVYIYISSKIKNEKYLYFFLLLYAGSYIVNMNILSSYVDEHFMVVEELEGFNQYISEIAIRSKSFQEQTIFVIIMFLLIRYFDTFSNSEKVFALSALTYYSLQGYAMYTMLRSLCYYQMFIPFIIPVLFYKMIHTPREKLDIVIGYSVIIVYFTYSLYSFNRDLNTDEGLQAWRDFTTIFSVPNWI